MTESERHRVLSSTRRRVTLDVLARRGDSVHLRDLAAAVAEREDGPASPDGGVVDRVAVSLHHVHLPKLSDHDLVDYDRETNVASRGGRSVGPSHRSGGGERAEATDE